MRKLGTYFSLFTLSIIIFAMTTLAQQPDAGNRLSGTVTDVANAVIADAVLSLVDANGAIMRADESDAEGRYSFPNVPVGSYALLTSKPGFTTSRQLQS